MQLEAAIEFFLLPVQCSRVSSCSAALRVSKMNKELFLLLNLKQAFPFAPPPPPLACCIFYSNGLCRVALRMRVSFVAL